MRFQIYEEIGAFELVGVNEASSLDIFYVACSKIFF